MTDNDNDNDNNTAVVLVNIVFAKGIGYLIGIGSLLLYTPIAIRICRQQHANGLVISTWWLKLISYILSDIFYTRKHYILSTWFETFIITIESTVVLFLVAYYQQQMFHLYPFWCMVFLFIMVSIYGFNPSGASIQLISVGQLGSAIINTTALVPQFHYNYKHKNKGDYSPITCILAGVGCTIRLYTTVILNNSDPILLISFLCAMIINFLLLFQIIYYGLYMEGLTLKQVLTSDIITTTTTPTNTTPDDDPSFIIQDDELNDVDYDSNGGATSRTRIDLQLGDVHSSSPSNNNDNDTNNVHTEQCGIQQTTQNHHHHRHQFS